MSVKAGQGGQEAVLKIRNRILDFIVDHNPDISQEARAPEDRYLAAEIRFGQLALAIVFGAIHGVEVSRDGVLPIQNTLASDLARMRSQDGNDQCTGKKLDNGRRWHALLIKRAEATCQRVRPGVARAPPPALDVIFSEIGDLEEGGEGMDKPHRFRNAQPLQLVRQLARRLVGCFAMEAYGCTPDILDLTENIFSVLFADRIAENCPKHANDRALLFRVIVHVHFAPGEKPVA